MLKYYNSMVVFEEVPNEITLAINITNCPCKCSECHSKFLWEDIGTELTHNELEKLIKINDGISCVCFMGHGSFDGIKEAISLSNFIKSKFGLKTALYSGFTNIRNIVGIDVFDFIKEGKYESDKGGLNNINTNQRFYQNVKGEFIDKTELFWKKSMK